MQIYWAPRTRSLRALWLLEEIGCPYERVLVDIRSGAQDEPTFRAINPMGKVPALADGEARVAESGAICAYLADRFPEAELAPSPGDPLRGRYLQWLFFAAGCLEPAFLQRAAGLELSPVTAGWSSAERVSEVLERALSGGPWILGERFTAADCLLGTDIAFGIQVMRALEPRPAFTAYVERCDARPARQRALAIDAGG